CPERRRAVALHASQLRLVGGIGTSHDRDPGRRPEPSIRICGGAGWGDPEVEGGGRQRRLDHRDYPAARTREDRVGSELLQRPPRPETPDIRTSDRRHRYWSAAA